MSESAISDHHAVTVQTEDGRRFDLQEFGDYFSRVLEFLGSRPGFYLEKFSTWEGMRTDWCLWLVNSRILSDREPTGPLLTYCNVRRQWVGAQGSADTPLKVFVEEA